MNDNKIFDIMPPGRQEKPQRQERPVQNKPVKPLAVPGPTEDVAEKKAKGVKSNFKKFLILFAALLIIFVLLSQFVLSKTNIEVYPKTATSSISSEINVNSLASSTDISSDTIPGKIFTEEKTVSQEFSATGQTMQGSKAGGTIRVYNDYSTSPQILVKNTRFVSSGGKLFRTTKQITIPGATIVSGKLQPSYILVQVLADQPGEDYNIGPSTFSIPGFVGTAKYTSFYGKSTEAMTGGSLAKVAQVTQDDLDAASEQLTAKAKSEGAAELKNKIPQGYVFMEDAVYSVISTSSSSQPVGAVAGTFTYTVTDEMKVISFSSTSLNSFAKDSIISGLEAGKEIQPGSLNVDYKLKSLDMKGGDMVLSSDYSAKIYSSIDTSKLEDSLMGKSLTSAKQILSQTPEISKAQIKSWPFWQNSIPNDPSKVKIQLILDSPK